MTRLAVVAGDGVVARRGESVLLCAAGTPDALVEGLLDAHRQVADEHGDGGALADAVRTTAGEQDVSLVAFAPAGDSLVVTVFGAGWAVVATEYGEHRLAPRRAPPGGLRSTVPGAPVSVRAGFGEAALDAPVLPWSDLEAGVARAGGLVLGADEPSPMAEAVGPEQPVAPREGPRPPLGVLVLDDGSVFTLDRDYVVGRDPALDPDVAAGTARPLRIEDPEGLLSRVHARIHLDGWDVSVVDLGSSNGTGIQGPRDTAWTRAPAHAALVIESGTQIGLGRRQLRYESRRSA